MFVRYYCLGRRLCKFIFNMMHNESSVVRQVTTYKLLCPRSTIADTVIINTYVVNRGLGVETDYVHFSLF